MKKLQTIKTPGAAFSTKKGMALLLTIFLVILSGPAFADQISSIDELTAPYSSESCIECHRETHKGWKKSWHGRSIIDSRVLKTWRTFILSGLDRSEGSKTDLKDICLPCHAPQTKDASDDLVKEIAGMIITAVEEIDTYETEDDVLPPETEDKAVPSGTETIIPSSEPEAISPSSELEDEALPSGIREQLPSSTLEDEITITDIMGTDSVELKDTLAVPEDDMYDSPWIRDEVNGTEDITFGVFEEPAPGFIEEKDYYEAGEPVDDTAAKPVEGPVPGEDEILIESELIIESEVMVESKDTALEPAEDQTVSFAQDGEIPLEPAEDLTMEVEDMTATIVLDDGKVKIEYSPYDPSVDPEEPAFLDKGETLGEKAVKELSKLNINCMICHSMKALPGGNPRPKTIYGTSGSGSIEHKEALGAETRISGFMKTSEFCAQCHHGCPPGMPSSICPTIWTSYKEKYIARGGDKTCQDCHMRGADKISHSFPGIYETEHVKKGVILTLDAEPTRHVYHLKNRIVPAVVMNVKVKNTAGHGIPNGCTYIPQTALQVSITDQNGTELFFKEKIYGAYNLHLPDNKEGYLGLNDWDITAMNRINLGIDPGDTDSITYVAPLNEDTTSIVIEAVFKYLYEEGSSAVIHKETRKIEFEIEKKSPRM